MRVRIWSDGSPKATRVVLVLDDDRTIDISGIVDTASWRLAATDEQAKVELVLDQASVEIEGELGEVAMRLLSGAGEPAADSHAPEITDR